MRTTLAYSLFRGLRAVIALAMLVGLASGCQFYFDDPPECSLPEPSPPLLLLDPATGECVPFDIGPICDPDTCTCVQPAIAFPSWAPCNSYCNGLDEYACMSTPGCRATYHPDGFYYDCYATDQTGPIQGECEGLDAWECSRHDDCVAIHDGAYYIAESQPLPLGWFVSCDDEPVGCTADDQCAPGQRCNAEEVCVLPPGCVGNPVCDPVCGGFCVPDERGACFGEVFCDVAEPVCPPGTTPGVSDGCYTFECIPLAECAPVPYDECHGQPACDALPPDCPEGHVPQHRDGCWTGACIPLELCEQEPPPGACFGTFTCDAEPPQCAPGTTPGIANGCFDGSCIPLDQCGAWPPAYTCTSDVICEREPPYCPEGYTPLIDGTCYTDICAPVEMCEPAPVCSDITDEDACLAAPSCTPVYTGVDCTCTADGCTCERWQFDRCQ